MRVLEVPAQLWSVVLLFFLRIVAFCTHGVDYKSYLSKKKKKVGCDGTQLLLYLEQFNPVFTQDLFVR